jgi:hypothetical protein
MFRIIYTTNRDELKCQYIEARNLAECLQAWQLISARLGADTKRYGVTISRDNYRLSADLLPAKSTNLKLVGAA